MPTWREGIEGRARRYATQLSRQIENELGFGYDGIVFSTSCQMESTSPADLIKWR
jgi:hypothetical protein